MAPNPDFDFDIFAANDAFGVDDGLQPQTPSSSSAVAMPQSFTPELDDSLLLPSDLAPSNALQTVTFNELRTDGRQSVNPWDPRLAMDLAVGVDSTEEIIERYGLDKDAFERLCEVPAFRRELSVAVREVRENGVAYSERCKVQSMMYLERVDNLIHDATTPASTVLDAIKWIGKMAKLEPKEEKGDSGASGTTVNLCINFANSNVVRG